MARTDSPAGQSWVNATIWRVLAWLGVALQAIALIAVLLLPDWRGAATVGIFLVVSAGFLVMKEYVPSLLSLLLIIASAVNAGGWAWDWFEDWRWLDETLHTFTPLALLAAVMYGSWARDAIERKRLSSFVLAAAGIGLGIGIVWELFEWAFLNLDLTWGDTVSDIILDTLGAGLGGALAYWAIGRRRATGSA